MKQEYPEKITDLPQVTDKLAQNYDLFDAMSIRLLYNDFIVNIYIQWEWEQVFTTY
jgi:hypothetical protein